MTRKAERGAAWRRGYKTGCSQRMTEQDVHASVVDDRVYCWRKMSPAIRLTPLAGEDGNKYCPDERSWLSEMV